MKCPFCKADAGQKVKVPNGGDSYILQAFDSKRNAAINSGYTVDVYACPNCDSVWLKIKN